MLSRLSLLSRGSRRVGITGRFPVGSSLLRIRLTKDIAVRSFNESFRILNSGKPNNGDSKIASLKVDKPVMMIAFTCKKCNNRSSHTMSKQAYTGGTVLITCPSCKTRHLIADHLKIFSDNHVTIEDILKAKGESVSSTTDDLIFEDIPENLQNVIGHHAKDAPKNLREKMDNEKVHTLPYTSSNTDN